MPCSTAPEGSWRVEIPHVGSAPSLTQKAALDLADWCQTDGLWVTVQYWHAGRWQHYATFAPSEKHPHTACLTKAADDPAAAPEVSARIASLLASHQNRADDPTRNEEEENRDDA
jgi:hypothetical protein